MHVFPKIASVSSRGTHCNVPDWLRVARLSLFSLAFHDPKCPVHKKWDPVTKLVIPHVSSRWVICHRCFVNCQGRNGNRSLPRFLCGMTTSPLMPKSPSSKVVFIWTIIDLSFLQKFLLWTLLSALRFEILPVKVVSGAYPLFTLFWFQHWPVSIQTCVIIHAVLWFIQKKYSQTCYCSACQWVSKHRESRVFCSGLSSEAYLGPHLPF